MGLLSGLLALFGCGDNKNTKSTSEGENSKVQMINPNDLLFTMPTINNSLPEFKEETDTCATFHEDEWRQLEFISKDQKSAIDKELIKIKDIYDNHADKGKEFMGFKKVAVRDLIEKPLSIDFSKLKSYLTDKPIKLLGLGLENNPGQVRDGFFMTIDGIGYYGSGKNNVVTTFGIYSSDSDEHLKAATIKLSKLLSQENLYLVDWRSMRVFDEKNITTDLASTGE